MALTILQQPLDAFTGGPEYTRVPVGQQLVFAVSDTALVANAYNVKYIADVNISTKDNPVILVDDTTRIGSFKTTPNNAGSGIFDLRPIVETFVKPDNEASEGQTSYKGNTNLNVPIHLVDLFSLSDNSVRFMGVDFYVEYSVTPTSETLQTDPVTTSIWTVFNGVLHYNNPLTLINDNYGYDMDKFTFYNANALQFLTNAPLVQYARATDYGTFSFLNWTTNAATWALPQRVHKYETSFYNASGSLLLTKAEYNTVLTGGTGPSDFSPRGYMMYIGGFPANLRVDAAVDALFTAGTVEYYKTSITPVYGSGSLKYIVNIICADNPKNFEMIRLTWLNQWGTWDYYTFTMKSTRSVSTKRIPYQQQEGTWNEGTFKIKGWKGGKKNFKVNSTQKIKLNTDFVTEAEGEWFEELINSPEVYIVNEYDGTEVSPYNTITNKYIEPVTLTTSNYIRKTIANDKLMQYTFEIEKTKMQRTQSV